MNEKRQTGRGFSLVELLLVLAILAVLVSVAVPTLGAARARARETVRAVNLRAAKSVALERLLLEPERYPLREGESGWQCFATFSGQGELVDLTILGARDTGELPEQWLDDNCVTFHIAYDTVH